MSAYQLAQLNIALPKAPLDSPIMADFVANIGRINTLAEQSPGFIWRLKEDDGPAANAHPFGATALVNVSVWQDIAALHDFAFRSGHVEFLKRRREWFERAVDAYAVLWWVPRGHQPTATEAAERLASLKALGATAYAFTFRDAFSPPDSDKALSATSFDAACPANLASNLAVP